METWKLNHPDLGLIEFQRGYDAEFVELDPSWPEEPEEFTDIPTGAGLKERFRGMLENPSVRGRILLNGEVLQRLRAVDSGRHLLKDSVDADKLTVETHAVDRDKPHVKVTANLFSDVLDVEFRRKGELVLFDPPAGSRGEKRRQDMESSTLKRVGFPILAGLGKGGWAIAVIVLAPLVSRFVKWLLSFLPDFDINFPQLPTLPQIELPTPSFPQIALPTPNINLNFNIPEPPAWVLFLLDYSKIWIPILIGIVVGLLALRNYKKSEETKKAWKAKKREEPAARAASSSFPQDDEKNRETNN